MPAIRPNSIPGLLGRGIWREPYTMGGREVLVAVDRYGDVVKRVQLRDGVDPVRAAEWLATVLDRQDPTPVLRLILPSGAAAPRRAREVDPRMYSDPRSPLARRRYLRGLALEAGADLLAIIGRPASASESP